jgi:hypothetical protein
VRFGSRHGISTIGSKVLLGLCWVTGVLLMLLRRKLCWSIGVVLGESVPVTVVLRIVRDCAVLRLCAKIFGVLSVSSCLGPAIAAIRLPVAMLLASAAAAIAAAGCCVDGVDSWVILLGGIDVGAWLLWVLLSSA